MKKIIKYKEYNEKFDDHKLWLKSIDICEKYLINTIENNFDNLPQVILDILENFYNIKQENNILLISDYIQDRGHDYIKYIDKFSAYYIANIDDIKKEINHFCNYYLGDDGDISLINNKLQLPDYDTDSYFDDNITQTGAALWILEQLNYNIPCFVVKHEKDKDTVLFEENTFSDSVDKLQKYIIDNNIDIKCSRLDMVSITGKYGISIYPKF